MVRCENLGRHDSYFVFGCGIETDGLVQGGYAGADDDSRLPSRSLRALDHNRHRPHGALGAMRPE